ncbi:MAG: SAM-dependent methyltransferase [Desulfosalsimonas sp.]|uniref:SAM-dependent methyltransferase n=1 Tax=Desulfosalsimonas sp. TaxID=3073848 RepID=UPI003970D0D7
MKRIKTFSAFIFVIPAIFLCLSAGGLYAGDSGKTGLYLVSTGSGDPENITFKAADTIKDSDVIFCRQSTVEKFPDLLEDKQIHDPGFGIFAVHGKTPEEGKEITRFDYDEKMAELEKIFGIIREAVKEGKTVSVLCSGDPTIYGPNMWYMEEFADLDPEIITGVSAFNNSNAALKKGVTSGKKAHSVTLTATFGRAALYDGPDSVDKLAKNQAAMAFFTMFMDIEAVVEKLLVHYPEDTPAAIVKHAGYSDKEEVMFGTLANIAEKTQEEPGFEYMFYIGDFMNE